MSAHKVNHRRDAAVFRRTAGAVRASNLPSRNQPRGGKRR